MSPKSTRPRHWGEWAGAWGLQLHCNRIHTSLQGSLLRTPYSVGTHEIGASWALTTHLFHPTVQMSRGSASLNLHAGLRTDQDKSLRPQDVSCERCDAVETSKLTIDASEKEVDRIPQESKGERSIMATLLPCTSSTKNHTTVTVQYYNDIELP